jgi:hypothetical protein
MERGDIEDAIVACHGDKLQDRGMQCLCWEAKS